MPPFNSILVHALIALCGAVAGSLVNLGIYTLGFYRPRAISPWSKLPEGVSRSWIDAIPILGWLRLRRESALWGRAFWVRPLLIELALAVGLPWLYHQEITGDLLPRNAFVVIPSQLPFVQFASHTILILLMTVATFIDFDEKTIPDTITVPGTLIGLGLAALFPMALPPVLDAAGSLRPLWITTDRVWPAWLDRGPGVLLGIACFSVWCYALVPKTVTLRRGWWKGWLYLHASTFRTPAWWQLGLLAVLGSLGILGVWSAAAATDHWRGLLTSLVGMAFGGGVIWAVRIVGYLGLRKEAMGFGDVTLMAMIGAYLGWQSTIMVFFLAPFAAVIIALAQWILTRRRDIAFGPYLCAGALFLILKWPWLWTGWGAPIFGMGWFVPALLACGLALMLGLLMLIRIAEEAIFARFAK